jgi:peptide/nickel transport system ATP-binding protein
MPAAVESVALSQDAPVLEVEDLRTHFFTRSGAIRAVDGVSFTVREREVLGIVGESGCGKTVTALSLLRLVRPSVGRIVSGVIRLCGRNLIALSEAEMRKVRGNEISMIFQEPMTSLNPVLTIGHQIAESVIVHQRLGRRAALRRAAEMLRLVQIPDPDYRLRQYPHEISGGMRQRAMIAMALACNPKLLIADEPTTALDMTIQAQILRLMLDLQKRLGTAILLITHDLAVVADTAERVLVMYAGRVVEEAPVGMLFSNPMHPYTRGLLAAHPSVRRGKSKGPRQRLAEIPGTVALVQQQSGCTFAPRCSFARDRCHRAAPPVTVHASGHRVACWEAATIAEATGG